MDVLPNELVARVLRLLPYPALARARRVCRRWRAVVDDLPLADRGLPNARTISLHFKWAFKAGRSVAAAWLRDRYREVDPKRSPWGYTLYINHWRQIIDPVGLRMFLEANHDRITREGRVECLASAIWHDVDAPLLAELARTLDLTLAEFEGPPVCNNSPSMTSYCESDAESYLVVYACDITGARYNWKNNGFHAPTGCLALCANHSGGRLCGITKMGCWVAQHACCAELTAEAAAELLPHLVRRGEGAAARALYAARPDMRGRFDSILAKSCIDGGYNGYVFTRPRRGLAGQKGELTLGALLATLDEPLGVLAGLSSPDDMLEAAVAGDCEAAVEHCAETLRQVADGAALGHLYAEAPSRAMVDGLLRLRPDAAAGAAFKAAAARETMFGGWDQTREDDQQLDLIAYKLIRVGARSGDFDRDFITTLAAIDAPIFGEFVDTVLADTLHGPRAVVVLLYALLASTYDPPARAAPPDEEVDTRWMGSRRWSAAPACIVRYLSRVTYTPTREECLLLAHAAAASGRGATHAVAAMLPGVRRELTPMWRPGAPAEELVGYLEPWPAEARHVESAITQARSTCSKKTTFEPLP